MPPDRPTARSPDAAPWWRTYFGDDFFELHTDLFPEEASRREVSALIELMGLPIGARLLDVPCGWGRHSHLLAQAGFDTTGTDLSSALLRRARVAGQATNLRGFVASDIRALPFATHSFDGAFNIFTSLGLFLNDQDDLAALRELRRVLRPGGRFLLESMHRDDVISAFAERDAWTLPDGTEVQVRRRFDAVRGISHEQLRWRRGAETGEKRHALKLRTATEIDALLAQAGFREARYFGDWHGAPFRHDSAHLIALADAP